MQDKSIMAVIDAPEITLADDAAAGDALILFYKALGWNGEDILDPCQVRTTRDVFYQLHALMSQKCPDPLTVGMALVNKGPGVDDDVPPGKVRLLQGWIKPAPPQGESGACE